MRPYRIVVRIKRRRRKGGVPPLYLPQLLTPGVEGALGDAGDLGGMGDVVAAGGQDVERSGFLLRGVVSGHGVPVMSNKL